MKPNLDTTIEFDVENAFPEFLESRTKKITVSIERETKSYYVISNNNCCEIEKKEVEELLNILNTLNIAMLTKFGMGVDGVTYTMRVVNGFNSVTFKWWSDTQGKQWNELIKLRKLLYKLKFKNFKK